MIEVGKKYVNKFGQVVEIAGRVVYYGENSPWVWSTTGDHYCEDTGRFVFTSRDGSAFLSVRPCWRCIADHTPIE